MARKVRTHNSREAARIDSAKRSYVSGDISLDEFETRVSDILSGDVERMPRSGPIFPAQRVQL